MGLSRKQIESIKHKLSSEFMNNLNKLDSIYEQIDILNNNINSMIKQRDQLIEDSEMMELLLMHKFNKENR